MDELDYREYLSIDNGKGLLISKHVAYILDKYKIDYKSYRSLSSLIFDINNYINNIPDDYDIEDLEEAISILSEMHYYNETKK